MAQQYGTIEVHTWCCASVLVVFVVFCMCTHSFAGLIRPTPPPTFSDTAITARHSDTTIFQLKAYWVRISWSICLLYQKPCSAHFISLEDCPILMYWMSPFNIEGVSGFLLLYYSYFSLTLLHLELPRHHRFSASLSAVGLKRSALFLQAV